LWGGDRLQKAQAEECLLFSWFIVLYHCSIMCLCCLPYLHDIFPTAVARCSLFVLKVPSNIKQTNKQVSLYLTVSLVFLATTLHVTWLAEGGLGCACS